MTIDTSVPEKRKPAAARRIIVGLAILLVVFCGIGTYTMRAIWLQRYAGSPLVGTWQSEHGVYCIRPDGVAAYRREGESQIEWMKWSHAENEFCFTQFSSRDVMDSARGRFASALNEFLDQPTERCQIVELSEDHFQLRMDYIDGETQQPAVSIIDFDRTEDEQLESLR